jgi:DUF1680 family protein
MSCVISLFLSGLMVAQANGQNESRQAVRYAVPARLPDAAEVLAPSQIKIGGWLGARIAANEKNRLLVVDTEPLLAGYRHRPGSHPWIGEHVGKWLHAATLAWANTGDAALRTKLDQVAADLISCQEPDGYLGTYVSEKRFGLFDGADWDVWSHKYNMIGLLTYYQFTGNEPALQCCRKMADLLIATFPATKSILKAGTHVGMAATSVLEPIVLLYRFTGDTRYLRFAAYIVRSWDEPGGPALATSLRAGKGVNHTANGKAYEMLSNLVGLCELARAIGDKALLEPVQNAWMDIVSNRLYITGSASAGEHFQGDHDLPNQPGRHIGETCVTTTWIQLNLQLLRLTGEAKYGDELERSFYNHLAAAQHPRGDNWCYYTALEGKKPYDPGINCCHSSGPRGMALAVQSAYLKSHADEADLLLVSTFESSRVRAVLEGHEVEIEQKSEFPKLGASMLVIHTPQPAKFALKLRVPAWAALLKVEVNGQSVEAEKSNGWALVAARQWKEGDRIGLSFGLGPEFALGTGSNAGRAALSWGPFVLAYDQASNPGLLQARLAGLLDEQPKLTMEPGPRLVFRGPIVGRGSDEKRRAVFVPFADAGSTGGDYRVWLRAPGAELSPNASVLADGQETRSREGNQNGSIVDGDPSSFVVTFDGRAAKEDWYAVILPAPARIARMVFTHGRNFHDGGWFDARGGKPRFQVQSKVGGAWETVGKLAGYPATTATDNGGLRAGQAFECHLETPVSAVAVRVIGAPSSGDNDRQAFSSCSELEAFGP